MRLFGTPKGTVPVEAVSRIAMVYGNEHWVKCVIDGGKLLRWVGIGWVEERAATAEDRTLYPTVKR